MGVSEVDGHMIISADYLSKGNRTDIYLDIVHELVHVRQFMEGKQLFDHNFEYVERPTEVEAYRAAVEEARRLGLGEKRICNYLKTEWMTDEEFRRLGQSRKRRVCTSGKKRTRNRLVTPTRHQSVFSKDAITYSAFSMRSTRKVKTFSRFIKNYQVCCG